MGLFGPSKRERDEAAKDRIEREARRGAREAAARRLAFAEREHKRKPTPITKAALDAARRDMN
jgi:hypothetical protein